MILNLTLLQNELKAPKSRYNSFGKFHYRSLEDIMTAVKPLLVKYELTLTVSDDVVAVGNRVYIRATANLKDAQGNTETVTAMAREPETKKGMDDSQLTGTASSYARKYCLNGLFAIDDTADADTDAYHYQTTGSTATKQQDISHLKPITTPADDKREKAIMYQIDHEPVYNREYLEKNGNRKINSQEIDQLVKAIENSNGKFTMEGALRACKKTKTEDIQLVQWIALMNSIKGSAAA